MVAADVGAADALRLVDPALRGGLAATLLLLATALWRARSAHAAARVGLALTTGLAVQTFASAPQVELGWPVVWQSPLVGVSVGNSVLFWLLARSLFEDDFVLRRRHGLVWAAVVAVGASFCLSVAAFGPHAPTTALLRVALRWTPAVFAALVIFAALSEWRADLVERRRRLRGFIVVAGTLYTVAMAAARLAAPHGLLSAGVASMDVAALLAIAIVTAGAVLRLVDGGGLWPSAPAVAEAVAATAIDPPAALPAPFVATPVATSLDATDAGLAQNLARLMNDDHVYRVPDLTVGLLAMKLGVPEYRLRRHIHQRLGHRNFNAYVNGLRLAEARAALADPARRETSVLQIAMDAGFASIGPFNRAFKAATAQTPSEFRRAALADC